MDVQHAADPSRIDRSSWLLTVLSALMVAGSASLCLVYLPRVEALYKDIGVALPTLTEWLIRLSRLGGGWGLVALALVDLGKEVGLNGRPGVRELNAVLLVLAGILAALILVAMFLPLLGLVENLTESAV